MRAAWLVMAAGCAACASILGVDHAFSLAEGIGDRGIRCGDAATYCTPSAQVCCWVPDDGGYSACVDPSACNGHTPMQCDTAAHCGDAGLSCCIALNASRYLLQSACERSCGAADAGNYVGCDPAAAGSCPPGTSCQELPVGNFSQDLGWFHACQ